MDKEKEMPLNEEEINKVKTEEMEQNPSDYVAGADASQEKEDALKSETQELKDKDNKGKISFMELLISNFADVTAISALSFIILFLGELILPLIGYRISDKISVYLIIFITISIFYVPICSKTKLGATIGQKLFFLRVGKED